MKTAIVTGGNKGIGLAACKGLLAQGYKVFLAARDAGRGQKACAELKNPNVEFLQLDIGDAASTEAAAKQIGGKIDRLDALVNNAGVFLDAKDNVGYTVDVKTILDTFNVNTLGALQLTRALVPLLAKANGAEVINVSSGMGQLSDMGTGSLAYRLSKTALNTVTRVMANELAGQRIRVNSICPGWVKTDMGGAGATRSVEQGADTIVWLATGQSGGKTGMFFRDRKEIPW